MAKLTILQFAHLGSVRVPQKLLALLEGKSLLEIGIEKLVRLKKETGVEVTLAVGEEETVLIEAARRNNLNYILRDQRSISSENWEDTVDTFKDKLNAQFDWVLDLNILCRPFLRYETIVRLVDLVNENPAPLVFVKGERGIVWDGDKNKILGAGFLADTKHNPVYYRLSHIGYHYPTVNLEESHLSSICEPSEIELQPEELIDIDTILDLEFAQRIAHCFL